MKEKLKKELSLSQIIAMAAGGDDRRLDGRN